jgi:hypothetical protein
MLIFSIQLLAKDWKKRLGSNGDAAEVKQDPYFAHIDWQKLIEKKLPPPYKPNVVCNSKIFILELISF